MFGACLHLHCAYGKSVLIFDGLDRSHLPIGRKPESISALEKDLLHSQKVVSVHDLSREVWALFGTSPLVHIPLSEVQCKMDLIH